MRTTYKTLFNTFLIGFVLVLLFKCSRDNSSGLTINISSTSSQTSLQQKENFYTLSTVANPASIGEFNCIGAFLSYLDAPNRGQCSLSNSTQFALSTMGGMIPFQSGTPTSLTIPRVEAGRRFRVHLVGVRSNIAGLCPRFGSGDKPNEGAYSKAFLLGSETASFRTDQAGFLNMNAGFSASSPRISDCPSFVFGGNLSAESTLLEGIVAFWDFKSNSMIDATGVYTFASDAADITSVTDSGATNSGAAYVFKREGSFWKKDAYLSLPLSGMDDFGSSVAIHGDTAVVGIPNEDSSSTLITNGEDYSALDESSSNSGAVAVFRKSNGLWRNEALLKASNLSDSDTFGSSIALSGNLLVVGSPSEDSSTTSIISGTDLSSANNSSSGAGAAYVYERQGNTWLQKAYLKAPNAGSSDKFANNIALENDTIAVSSEYEDSTTNAIINGNNLGSTNDSGMDRGAVYVFRKDATGNWAHEAYLKAPNHSDLNMKRFSNDVGIWGDTIVVATEFEGSRSTSIVNGADLSSVTQDGTSVGAAYVFKRAGSTWVHEAYLKAPNAQDNYNFAYSVAIHENTIAITSKNEGSSTTAIINGNDLSSTNNSSTSAGAAYVFSRAGSTWTHQAYLKAPNNVSNLGFGDSVSVSGDTIAIGAKQESSATNEILNGSTSNNTSGTSVGAVYTFKRSGANWSFESYLKAANSENSDYFGSSVALDGEQLIVGATGEDSNTDTIINDTYPGIVANGVKNTAMKLANTTSRFELADDDDFDLGSGTNDEFSISFWAHVYKPTDWWDGRIMSKSGSYNIVLSASGELQLQTPGNVGYCTPQCSFGSNSVTGWKHVVFTIDNNANTADVYIDGNFTKSITGIGAMTDQSSPLNIGGNGTARFKGKLDSIGFWSRLLTAAEIQELYNAGLGKDYPFP